MFQKNSNPQAGQPIPSSMPFQLRKFSENELKNIDFTLHKIKNSIRNLLEAISITYKECGIVYPVHQYFDPIFRMVSPVELSALVNANTINCMFQQKNALSNEDFPSNKVSVNVNSLGNFSILEMEGMDKKKSSCGARNSLFSRGLQKQILEWIQKGLKQGRIITKSLIMAKARQLGRYSNFKGCQSWCNHFLNRNPEIKQQIFGNLHRQKHQPTLNVINTDNENIQEQKPSDYCRSKNQLDNKKQVPSSQFYGGESQHLNTQIIGDKDGIDDIDDGDGGDGESSDVMVEDDGFDDDQ